MLSMAIYFGTENLLVFKKAVITIGTFDGVHKGHKAILHEVVKLSEQIGGESILLIFDPHPRKLLKSNEPLKILTPLHQKLDLLLKTGIKNIVVVHFTHNFANLSAQSYIEDFLINNFHPYSIIIGYDHHFGHNRTGNINLLRAYSDKFKYTIHEIAPQLIHEATVSSTKIRNAIVEGKLDVAQQMLERPYSIIGKVIHGNKLGRTIGYPTANLKLIEAEQLLPANGIYAVTVKHKNAYFCGMLNIGYNPTISEKKELKIEVNIFDFNSEIYDSTIEIGFIKKIRDEIKFSSINALKEQLGKDKLESEIVLRDF